MCPGMRIDFVRRRVSGDGTRHGHVGTRVKVKRGNDYVSSGDGDGDDDGDGRGGGEKDSKDT